MFGLLIAAAVAAPAADELDVSDVITIHARPGEETPAETLSPVTILSGEQLRRRLANTIGETIRLEPGVASTGFGQGASRPIIRGQGGVRVQVLDAGIGAIDASATSPDHAVALDALVAEQIEVVRGVAQLLYGSSATGGVVNVVNGRIPDERPEGGLDGALRSAVSTVDGGFDGAGAIDIDLGRGFVLHADGSYRDAGDYDIPGFAESADFIAAEEAEEEAEGAGHEEEEEEAFGVLENSFVERSSFAGGLSYIFENGFIGVSASRFETLYGVPGGHGHGHGHEEEEEHEEEHEHEEEEGEESVSIDLEQTRYDLRGELYSVGPFETLRLRAAYADYEHTELEGSEIGTVFTNEGVEARIEGVTPRSANGLRTIVGVQYFDRDFSAIGEEAFVDPSTTRQFGLFAFEDLERGPWRFEIGGRYEHQSVESKGDRVFALDPTADAERTFDTVSVSASAGYKPTEASIVSLNIFRTERAPAAEELFSNGEHLATNQFEIGDPNLDTETALGAEASFRRSSGPVVFGVNAFYTSYSDYIFELPVGETDEEQIITQFTARDVDFYGAEAIARVDIGSVGGFDVSIDGVVEYVEAKLDQAVDGVDDVPRLPPLGGVLGVEALSNLADVRVEYEFAASRDAGAGQTFDTDGYGSLNAFLTVHPVMTEPRLSLDVRAENLTNEEIRYHSSFLKDLISQPGRNITIALRYDF